MQPFILTGPVNAPVPVLPQPRPPKMSGEFLLRTDCHVTDQMKHANAERMEGFIKSVLNL